ncbi:nitrite reductase [Candidatus Mycolicibacterium alkanivorans]|uniref:Nitrite reductase n=1 Tax=Candidatus Mycolicibacterium alkanivorans TaxID=2954114 RepID=A0ABS9YX70_9MYCO|nr:nitrite reductase [Candidatus Mycolicibacterium alkanivorans]MCI4675824.1 nitrite reductase [Candidatus Mycolicibacterium alkanivorans]
MSPRLQRDPEAAEQILGRTRRDLCPGVSRPWVADDGLMVRLRLVGGRLPVEVLGRLMDISQQHADGHLYLTTRANLQIRGLPEINGTLPPAVVTALAATGLIPSTTHELVRNILVSPQSGIAGGRANLRSVASCLDAALRADPALALLPGRFLFTLDDGRGDMLDRLTGTGRRGTDLGLVVLTETDVQLRIGDHWGEVVRLDEAALHLAGLAAAFVNARGPATSAPWHLRELVAPLRQPIVADPRVPVPTPPLAYGAVSGGEHVSVRDGVLTPELARTLLATIIPSTGSEAGAEVIVTPWHGIFVPHIEEAAQ